MFVLAGNVLSEQTQKVVSIPPSGSSLWKVHGVKAGDEVIVECDEVVVVGCVMVDVHAAPGQYIRGQPNSHSPQSHAL